MSNSTDKSINSNQGYTMEEFLESAHKEGLQFDNEQEMLGNSSISEKKEGEQPEATKTLEIRFVPNNLFKK